MSSNRISHFFDFRGASMTLETGCSTTLVALHQAIQTLRNREADMSVVTGANAMLNPDTFKAIGSLGMLSPDGRSYAFDSRANGYGRGEGVATLIIKRLSDALAANDPIRAVIRETALNQDGKTDTITTPSGAAQVDLMRECYRRAGLDPRGTQYFEAHGTGTPTGDPIEAGAMAAVFSEGEGREDEANFLRIGSVKTNIGHTEAVSGLAAVIKGVLCLEKGLIPPSVNYETPNPKIKLAEWRLKVATTMEPWPDSLIGGPRRLSVNNFGYGGANAHVIMESADAWTTTPDLTLSHINGNGNSNGNSNSTGNGSANGHHAPSSSGHEAIALVLSARDERGCQQMVADLTAYLKKHRSAGPEASEQLLRNLSYTLCERRTIFQWVAAHQVRLDDDGTLNAAIHALDTPRFKPSRRPAGKPRIGMVFTGQGAQWYAMGRELLTSYPVFRQSITEAEAHLRSLGADWSLLEELQRDAKTTKVHATNISIPVCVALQIALVRLLASWGITPTAVTSHSSGEISAAYAVGALTHRQAMATAYYRAVLAADETLRIPGAPNGAMAAIGLGAEAAQSYLDKVPEGSGKAVIACINSPESVTVSGDADAIQVLEDLCKQDGVFARRLRVQQAYHSHHMNCFAEIYRERLRIEMARGVLQNLKQGAEKKLDVIFSSAVTGCRIDSIKDIASPDHWVGSLVQPVQFVEAFTEMVLGDLEDPSGRSVDVVLEVGPHTALGGPIREIMMLPEFEGIELPYWGCLSRDEHAGDSMRSAALNLLREGQPLLMNQINFPVPTYDDEGPRVLTDLPTYPWNHTIRHWQEARVNRAIRERSQPPHELLGMPVPGTDPSMHVWRRILRVVDTPWIRDHMVQGSIVYPGAGSICMAIEAARQLEDTNAAKKTSGFCLRDIKFLFALVVPDGADGVEIRTTLRRISEREIGARGWWRFEISSVTLDNRWTVHAEGKIMVERNTFTSEAATMVEHKPLSTYTRNKNPQDLFANLRARGIYHGPLFQNTARIIQDGREPRALCDIKVRHEVSTDTDPAVAAQNTLIHPITLDAIIVSFYSTLPSVGALQENPKLPRSIKSMWVSSKISGEIGSTLRCDALLERDDARSGSVDVTVLDGQTGATVLNIKDLECASLGRGSGATARQDAVNRSGVAIISKWEQELCSKLEWGPDLSLRQPRALAQIKKDLLSVEPEYDTELDLFKDLERACVHFAHAALQTLTPEDVVQLQQQPHLAKYHQYLKVLTSKYADEWTLDGPKELQQHIATTASQSLDGEVICSLGPLIAPILRGEHEIEEGELSHRYNAFSARQSPALMHLSTLVRKVAHKNPGARVLQIGTGAGSIATRRMLEAPGTPATLRIGSWHITEPSLESLEDVRTALADWADLLEFDRLDIEQSPTRQNFPRETYDIVVASQSLHRTKNVAETLANIRSLIKPGGVLLFAESTKGQIDVDFIRGLLPGWVQNDNPTSWNNLLQDAGFDGVQLEVRDSESDIAHNNSIFMSAVPMSLDRKADLSQANDKQGFVIVSSNKTPVPGGFIENLTQALVGKGAPTPAHVVLEETGFSAYQSKICIFLGELDQPMMQDLDDVCMDGLRAMVTQCSGLLWITAGGVIDIQAPERAVSQGFLRVLRNEYIGRRYLLLDLDPAGVAEHLSTKGNDTVSAIVQVLEEGFGHDDDEVGPVDFEYAERDGVLLIPRLYKDEQYNDMITGPLTTSWDEIKTNTKDVENPTDDGGCLFQESRPLRLEVGIPGHLDTLAFVDDEEKSDVLAPEIVEVTPRAYGLCSQDVMAAMGQIKDQSMGLECAGIITRVGTDAEARGYKLGDHVMALLPGASFTSRARVHWHGVIPMPSNMDFEMAASLPLVFTVAYAALVDVAHIGAGQSVLIHAAAGGLGQAAIMLAKYLGVKDIYATAGSQEERSLLMREHDIPAERIFSSRDASFAPALLASTKAQGVDVVLNPLPGQLLQASLSVVVPLGHLIEISKRDIDANSLVTTESFSRGISLTMLDAQTLLLRRGPQIHRVLGEISRLVEARILQPVYPVAVRPMKDLQTAFRLLQTDEHIGKIVLSAGPEERVHIVPRPKGFMAHPRLQADASYLVVGGVGGIGRSISHWLVAQGAKNLILMSRSAGDLDLENNQDSEGALFVRELRSAGCRVKPISCDIALASSLAIALRACEDAGFPPVRGVVQGAMLLRDAIFEQMTLDVWRSGLAPKLDGTWNLHTEFSQPGSLDFFVMLSSVSGIVGIASQTNYAAGGSYEDAIASWRQELGLPGVAIDLGPISDIGFVSKEDKVAERLRKEGDFIMIDEDNVLRALHAAVLHPLGARRQIIVGLNSTPGHQWDIEGRSQLARDARFSPLRPRSKVSRAASGDGGTSNSLSTQLQGVGTIQDGIALISAAIANKLADIFMIPVDDMDLTQPPAHFGLDSLIAVELRNMLVLQAGADVSIFNILQTASLEVLARDVAEKSRFLKDSI